MSDVEIKLGQFTISAPSTENARFSGIIWGPAGGGKTTLAATAPGKKLWINFDPDGTNSIIFDPVTGEQRDDILVLDLSAQSHTITQKFKEDDGLGIGRLLADDSHGITTVVVDSITAFSSLAVEHGISITKGATLERPSPGAYGARNALTLRLITGLLRLTAKYDKNIIFIAHEDAPVTNDEGSVLYITMSLGGKLADATALRLSEVWYMQDTGTERRILVRPGRTRKPMKTRIFDTTKTPEFIWKFNPEKPDPAHTIAGWVEKWKAGGGKKIPLPS